MNPCFRQRAAAKPAAWPEQAEPGMTRTTTQAQPSAETVRPAVQRFGYSGLYNARYGISYHYPAVKKSATAAMESGSLRHRSDSCTE